MEDRYSLLSAPELAGEEAFIRWVVKEENNSRWLQWREAHPDHEATINEAKGIVEHLASLRPEPIDPATKEALWQKINATIASGSQEKSSRKKHLLQWGLAAAASLALVIWINTSQPNKFAAYTGEQKEFILPESSKVIVNAFSTVSYKNNFNEARVVKLKGEAFFNVIPGSTFKVITDLGTVTVLGTSFNVVARKDHFEVSCYTGKVRVEKSETEKAEITAGEKIIMEGQKLKKEDFIAADAPAWTQGKFLFENQPLSVVADELERQFGIEVTLAPGLEELRYRGFFEKGDLDSALYNITWPLLLKSEVRDHNVSILR